MVALRAERRLEAHRRATTPARRWLELLLLFRALATAVAVALLAAQDFTPRDELLAVLVVVYAALTGPALLRWPGLARAPAMWAVDLGVTWGLVGYSGDWRSPFYLLCLTALALPAANLGRRRAVGLGMAASAVFFVLARLVGPDPLALGTQTSIQTLAIHLVLPALACFGIGSAAQVMRHLGAAQARAERLAVEAERRRIAWELHDSAKQRLHAAHLLLSAIGEPGDARVAHLVELAAGELRAASADMDTSLAELRLPLEGRRLGEALRERVGQLAEAGGPPVEVVGDVEGLTPLQTAHAYRVAAEAVTNAIRHAGADAVRVRLGTDGADAVVTVADDGRGMPEVTRPGATGLLAMRNRAMTIGGRLRIERGPGARGTQVQLSFPLEPKEF